MWVDVLCVGRRVVGIVVGGGFSPGSFSAGCTARRGTRDVTWILSLAVAVVVVVVMAAAAAVVVCQCCRY